MSDLNPSFSPDGSTVAFSSDRAGEDDIYLVDVMTEEVTRLTFEDGSDLDPSFGPDGSIAFDSDRGGGLPQIFEMAEDGTGVRQITQDPRLGGIFPSWSPDGDEIVYACGPEFEGLDTCLVAADGGDEGPLVATPGSREWEADWSPDGHRIVFVSDRTGDDEIYVMDADGTDMEQLTHNPGRDADPAWSPDGSEIAFDSERNGRLGIYIMRADGSGVRPVTEGSGAAPDWSPDGETIVFHGETPQGTALFLVPSDGGRTRRLT